MNSPAPQRQQNISRSPDLNMTWLSGGTFWMGSDRHYPEEAPAHRVTVGPFWIDRTPVTTRHFRRFVEATSYVTVAEIAPDPKDYPGALPHMLQPGSLVFAPPRHLVGLRDWSQWWRFEFGADWRRPNGRGRSNMGIDDHPVVQVAYKDAEAYAAWAGKALPTEAEWEYAGRGGLEGAEFAWGDELTPEGRHLANTWQGAFPHENLATDGYTRTSPVGVFPPNGYGRFDMIGNVWEWTADWYSARHAADAPKACCIPDNPRGGREADSYDQCGSPARMPQGGQGRLALVCAQLLPPLPSRRAPRPAHRHQHEPCRLPVRDPAMSDAGARQRASGAGRFEVRITADSHMAWLRTRLALERTMMSWLRTAVSLIGFGFAIVQFFERLGQVPGTRPARYAHAPQYLGLALISCGVLALVISIWQYRWTVRYMWSETFAPVAGLRPEGMQSPVLAVAILLICIGFFAFAAVLLRIV